MMVSVMGALLNSLGSVPLGEATAYMSPCGEGLKPVNNRGEPW